MTDDESLLVRWGRRALSIPIYTAASVGMLLTLPLWVPLAFVADRLRPGRCALRTLCLVLVFLLCELAGIAVSFALWLRRPFVPRPGASAAERAARYDSDNYALQARWIGTIFGAAKKLFRLRITTSGDEALRHGPMLLFLRHTSLADVALAATQVTIPTGIGLRYVLKRELLWDPCLDIVGNRLPNVFTRRGSGDAATEIERITRLTSDLAPNEGILIYPEGTRFTEGKREERIRRLEQRGDGDGARRAAAYRHVLPPKLGGPCALLERNPGLDVVVCAHAGLETATGLGDVWSGALLDGEIRLAFWRIPFEELPTTRTEREALLFEQWRRVDDWVEEQRAA